MTDTATDTAAEIAAIKTGVSALIPLLRESAEEIDEIGRLPDTVLQALHDAGVYRITEPEVYGGGGLAPVPIGVLCDVIMEVSRGNGSAGWSVMIGLGPLFLKAYGDEIAREVLNQPHIGPRIAGTVFMARSKAEARRVDGGYLIKGTWGFPSNIWHCAWLYGGCAYTDDDGNRQWMMALLPRSDLKIADDWHVVGLKGSGSNTAFIDTEVFVPAERLIHASRFQTVDPSNIVLAHLALSSMVIGCALGALDYFIETAKRRAGWAGAGLGGAGTIAAMASTQSTVAKVRAEIALADIALHHAAECHDRAKAGGSAVPAEESALLAYVVVHATQQARRAVEELAIAIGSSTAADADPMNRYLRDLRVACLHGLVRPEPQAEKYGRQLLGIEESSGPNMPH